MQLVQRGCSLLNPDIGYLYVVFFYHKYIQFWTILNKISLYKRISKSNYPEIKYLGKVILKYMYYFGLPIFQTEFSNPYCLFLQHISSLYMHTPQSDIDYLLNSLVVQPSHCDIVFILFLYLLFFFNLYFLKFSLCSYLPNDAVIFQCVELEMNMNFYCLAEYSNCW